MAKFDRDKVLDIIRNGSDAEQEILVEELEKMLDAKKYGLVWERGGTSEDSPFEAEDVVLQISAGIPYPVHREDLSIANKRERERERAA